MSEIIPEICWKCGGTGKLRNNIITDGAYRFGEIECDVCCGFGEFDANCSDDEGFGD